VLGHAGGRAHGQSWPCGPGLADSPLVTVMEPVEGFDRRN